MLRVEGNGNTGQFQSIKARLAGMPPAYTAEQIAKGQTTTGPRTVATGGRRVVNVEPPSNAYRTHQPANFLRISVPANWDAVDASAVSAPTRRTAASSRETTTAARVHARRADGRGAGRRRQPAAGHAAVAPEPLASNPDLRAEENSRRETIGGRQGLTTPLSNVSQIRQRRIRHAVDDATARREPAQHHWRRAQKRTHSDAFASRCRSPIDSVVDTQFQSDEQLGFIQFRGDLSRTPPDRIGSLEAVSMRGLGRPPTTDCPGARSVPGRRRSPRSAGARSGGAARLRE